MTKRNNLESYVSQLLQAINQRGFSIYQDPDLGGWRRFMEGADGIVAVNPSFDPAHHDFPISGGQYWLRVTAGSKQAACIAFRLLETGEGGWIELLESGHLFSTRLPRLGRPRVVHPAELNWKGRIGHHGGLWVAKEFRKMQLPYLLTHLVRALSVQRYDVDHHCGLVFEDLKESGLPLRPDGYGYTRADLSLIGFTDAVGKHARMYTTQIDRAAMKLQIAHGPLYKPTPVRRAA